MYLKYEWGERWFNTSFLVVSKGGKERRAVVLYNMRDDLRHLLTVLQYRKVFNGQRLVVTFKAPPEKSKSLWRRVKLKVVYDDSQSPVYGSNARGDTYYIACSARKFKLVFFLECMPKYMWVKK